MHVHVFKKIPKYTVSCSIIIFSSLSNNSEGLDDLCVSYNSWFSQFFLLLLEIIHVHIEPIIIFFNPVINNPTLSLLVLKSVFIFLIFSFNT
jgi:hypothetical protein